MNKMFDLVRCEPRDDQRIAAGSTVSGHINGLGYLRLSQLHDSDLDRRALFGAVSA